RFCHYFAIPSRRRFARLRPTIFSADSARRADPATHANVEATLALRIQSNVPAAHVVGPVGVSGASMNGVTQIPHALGHRVLIVDDDAVFGDIASRVLEASGFQVRWTEDGFEGLSLLQAGLPDAV